MCIRDRLNTTYLWPNSDVKAIDKVTTNITKGSLTMVISQDNAIFLSLLQELNLDSGHCTWNLSESISYVGSSPWIIGEYYENVVKYQSQSAVIKVMLFCLQLSKIHYILKNSIF